MSNLISNLTSLAKQRTQLQVDLQRIESQVEDLLQLDGGDFEWEDFKYNDIYIKPTYSWRTENFNFDELENGCFLERGILYVPGMLSWIEEFGILYVWKHEDLIIFWVYTSSDNSVAGELIVLSQNKEVK